LLSSSGFSINAHYCKGELKNIDLLFIHKCKPCCGTKKMSHHCCQNKIQTIKIIDKYIPAQIVLTPATEFSIFALAFIKTFNLSITENVSFDSALNFSHPPGEPISLSILYRSILI